MKRSLGIAIVTYNSAALLDSLFTSLRRHTDLGHVRFAVVDNASGDATIPTLEVWRGKLEAFEILAQASNTGFAEGCNIAIRHLLAADCDQILLLNPDTEVTPGWLPPLEAALAAHPKMAAVQPLLCLYDDPELVNSSGNVVHFLGFGYCDGYRAPVRSFPSEGVAEVGYGTGACLLIRRAALVDVGLFDAFYFLYHEDFDLQIRMRQAGWSIGIAWASRVLHKYRPNMSGAKFRWLERNRLLALAKLWPAERLLLIAPALLGVEVVMLAFSAKEHWLKEKLSIYVELLANARSIAASRRETNRHRVPDNRADEAQFYRAEMQTEALAESQIVRLGNKILSVYLDKAGKLLGTSKRS